MTDFDEFDQSLSLVDNYLSSLSRSMSLVLEEFYANILSIGVSSLTGKGIDEKLLAKFEEAKKEYDEVFLPEIQQRMTQRSEEKNQVLKEDEPQKVEEKVTEKKESNSNMN